VGSKIRNSKFKVFIFLSLFTFNFSLLTLNVFAVDATSSSQVADVGFSRIDPSSPLYFLKTIRENIEVSLAQTPRVKNLRQLEFATRRLRESKTLIGKNEDLITPTLERYISHLKNLTDTHLKVEQQFADDLRNNLSIHLKILEQMHQNASSLRAKMAIRSAMNKVIKRQDVANTDKSFVCSFFEKESSSSALNQTEQYVLKDRAKVCKELLGKLTSN
jgi:hypothetical protein